MSVPSSLSMFMVRGACVHVKVEVKVKVKIKSGC